MTESFHYEISATLILKEGIGADELKEELSNFGDCLTVSQYKDKTGIHIHAKTLENKKSILAVLIKTGRLLKFTAKKEYWEEEQ